MTLHGKIQNGGVVFDSPANLPEGTLVTVVVEQPQAPRSQTGRLTEEEFLRRKAILDEVTALPNENPGDTFSGRDHDQVLYPAEGRMP